MNSPAGAWIALSTDLARAALLPLADGVRAVAMADYMKDVAPFLGIAAAERRRVLRGAWRELDLPTSEELGHAALALMSMREREFHYAAYDLIDRYRVHADARFLHSYMTELLTTTPWWDTVDGLVTAGVSPLMRAHPDDLLIDTWSESGNLWLIRAAVTHQRGWKADTDVPRVLALCDRHWSNPEFFVAKAIGWALRDVVKLDPPAVRRLLQSRQLIGSANRVAQREVERALERAAVTGAT